MKRGFTLIELLVVIAIIAILAAILFPVFAQAKRAAKGAVSRSNLKQVAIALQLYLSDYEDTFHKPYSPDLVTVPTFQFSGGWGLGASTIYPLDAWTWYYAPYLKTPGVYIDPNSPTKIDFQKPGWGNYVNPYDAIGNPNGYRGHYGYNYDGLTQNVTEPNARSVSALEEPAGTYAVFTSKRATVFPGANNFYNLLRLLGVSTCTAEGVSDANSKVQSDNAFRFNKRAIVVYADSHVNTVPATKFILMGKQNAAPWMTDWRNSGAGGCPQEECPVFPIGPGKCFDPANLP